MMQNERDTCNSNCNKRYLQQEKNEKYNIEWLEEIPFDWKECRIKNVIFPVIKEVNDTDEIVTCF